MGLTRQATQNSHGSGCRNAAAGIVSLPKGVRLTNLILRTAVLPFFCPVALAGLVLDYSSSEMASRYSSQQSFLPLIEPLSLTIHALYLSHGVVALMAAAGSEGLRNGIRLTGLTVFIYYLQSLNRAFTSSRVSGRLSYFSFDLIDLYGLTCILHIVDLCLRKAQVIRRVQKY